MKIFKENDFIRGWFVGNFNPTCFNTDACEVAVKRYKKDDYEEFHHHKISTEITMIVDGSVSMNNIIYNKGDIILIEPKEGTDFYALEDTTNIVIKIPCIKNDKFMGNYHEEIDIA